MPDITILTAGLITDLMVPMITAASLSRESTVEDITEATISMATAWVVVVVTAAVGAHIAVADPAAVEVPTVVARRMLLAGNAM